MFAMPSAAVSDLKRRLIHRRRHEPHGITPQAMERVSASDASKPLHWSCAAFVWLALGTGTASRFLNVHLLFLRHHCFRQVKAAEQWHWSQPLGLAIGLCGFCYFGHIYWSSRFPVVSPTVGSVWTFGIDL